MNYSVFGKTMENLQNRVNVQLIHTKRKLIKQVAKSSFERYQILSKDLVGVQLKKTVVTLDKPISVGMSILELSKCAMYYLIACILLRKPTNCWISTPLFHL
jgi:hypothetical protein